MKTVFGDMQAVLFDKDGTLLKFHDTWDKVLGSALRSVAGGPVARGSAAGEAVAGGSVDTLQQAADAIGFDLEFNAVRPDSPFIAESNAEIHERLRPFIDVESFDQAMAHFASNSAMPADGIEEMLNHFETQGVRLAVVTNDSEAQARIQLNELNWAKRFRTVVGYDSGYGAKPAAGPVLGAVSDLGSAAEVTIMIGDAAQDLLAGKAAGAYTAYIGNDPGLEAIADVSASTLPLLLDSILGR